MSIRINGYAKSSILGYFMGKNALASIGVSTDGGIRIQDTGAVSSYSELQRVLGTEDTVVIYQYIVDQGIQEVNGDPWNISALEAQYTASYAAQVNLRRIIDIVQQRAVILSTSDIAHSVAVSAFKNEQNGAIADVAIASTEVVTFLIERAQVFDRDGVTFQGVPTAQILEGMNLISDLTGVPLLSNTGTEIKLMSSAVPAEGNFGIKIMKTIPAIY